MGSFTKGLHACTLLRNPIMKRILLENGLRGALLLALVLLPLPYGLVERQWSDRASVIFTLIAAGAMLALYMKSERYVLSRRQGIVAGAVLFFLLLGAFQLAPLGETVVGLLSPESLLIWKRGSLLSRMLGGGDSWPRISVDVELSVLMMTRLVMLLSVVISFAILFRRRAHRYWFAFALGVSAVLQFVIAFRQWIDPDPANTIWGWRNTAIVDRISGTFVNPNHFAHYLALGIPVYIYVGAALLARSRGLDRRDRLHRFFERELLPVVAVLLAVILSVFGVFLAQSRGTVLALAVSIVTTSLLVALSRRTSSQPRSRTRGLLLVGSAVVTFVVIGAVAVLQFGQASTAQRMFSTSDQAVSLRGRVEGVEASIDIWSRFPVFGSGLGTFQRLSWTEADRGGFLRHAHNDYLEILATCGISGLVALLLALALLIWSLGGEIVASQVDNRRDGIDREFYLLAAFAVLIFVMVHSTYDFNLFIPANPLTAAAIVGVACAARPRKPEQDRTSFARE